MHRPDLEIKLFPISKTKKVLAIAINHGSRRVNSTVKLAPRLAGKTVSVNDRIVARLSTQSTLKVGLEPYEVRLYKFG
jgi:hypothetical protein